MIILTKLAISLDFFDILYILPEPVFLHTLENPIFSDILFILKYYVGDIVE